MLTQERLKQLLSYDPETGIFYWEAKTSNRIHVGNRAGNVNDTGYRRIRIDGAVYLEHRLAWLYLFGEWPEPFIDHINGDPADNRIINLRVATRAINQQNFRRARKDSGTGVQGVYASGKRFSSRIKTEGKFKYLGMFDTKELAHQAYLEAKRKYHAGCTI